MHVQGRQFSPEMFCVTWSQQLHHRRLSKDVATAESPQGAIRGTKVSLYRVANAWSFTVSGRFAVSKWSLIRSLANHISLLGYEEFEEPLAQPRTFSHYHGTAPEALFRSLGSMTSLTLRQQYWFPTMQSFLFV